VILPLHGVIKGVGSDSPIEGLHRILWLNDKMDLLTTIEIPTWQPGQAAPRYYKGPEDRALSAYLLLKHEGHIVITNVAPHPIAGMTDAEIRVRYPIRQSELKKRKPRRDCAVIQYRDERWEKVEPIILQITDRPADAFEGGDLGRLIKDRIKKLGCEPVEIYDPVHRVLAHASGKNSILPAYCRSGGKGKSRQPKKVSRLGRQSAAFLAGEVPSPGIHLNEEDKRHLAIGMRKFLKDGLSVRQAYILCMGAWWSTGSRIEDGVELPILKPAHERPTLAQFRYWAERDPEGKSAFELLLKQGEWDKRFRAMLGLATHGLNGVGQMAVMDATGTHVTLVSMTSMLHAIGPAHRIVVHEGLTETITGFYVGLEPPGEHTANLAVYNSAMDKVNLFARFGLTITTDQVPAMYYRKYRLDNGEGRNAEFITQTTASGAAIEFVQRRSPQKKQQAESSHHVMHGLVEDHLDGATRGRAPERGEEHSAIPACWTFFAYMVEFLRGVIYFNCHADASALMARHPFRSEMLRDNVPPRRAAMLAWCIKNNRVAIPAHDVDVIRVKSLGVYKAIVKQNGIFLCRPDRGDKKELVKGPRYSGPRAMELGWHRGNRRDFPINVRMDPQDPNRIWFADELGIHLFENLSTDQTANREACLDDYIAMQDRANIQKTVDQSETDQEESDFVSHRENKNLEKRKAKKQAIAATGRKVSRNELSSNIKENRAKEAALIAAQLDPTDRGPKKRRSAPSSTESASASAEAAAPPAVGASDAVHQAVDAAPEETAVTPQGTTGLAAGSVVSSALAALRARRMQEA
jgi:putative transposase